MSELNDLKTRHRDVKVISDDKKLKLLASGNALGLRLISYTDRISAEKFLEEGLPFGTSLGASELETVFVPLLSANHDGSLKYQPAGDPDSVTQTNINLLATRKRLVTGWSTCTMLIVFPDDVTRYRQISELQAQRAPNDAYTAEEIYITLTRQWLNRFVDFNNAGQQIVPRAFIGGFVDLDEKELVMNIHYSESFVQSEEAKRRLPSTSN